MNISDQEMDDLAFAAIAAAGMAGGSAIVGTAAIAGAHGLSAAQARVLYRRVSERMDRATETAKAIDARAEAAKHASAAQAVAAAEGLIRK